MYSFHPTPFLRRKSSIFVVLMMLSFVVVSIEWHSDHDLNAKTPAQHHCCIQCCPSHNLAPLSANENYFVSSTTGREILPDHSAFHPEIYLNQIYRPPIV